MTKTDENINVGDLVYYFPVSTIYSSLNSIDNKPKLAIVVKAKNLLKLYDILIQTENIYLKDIHITWLQKAI
jgi:hypothetical protein